jgi:translocator protein
MKKHYGVLGLFLVVTVGGGLLIGSQTQTQGWYENLRKPAFTPPNIAFPVAWTILYVLIGFAGWRVWRSRNRPALGVWTSQLLLNFAWTPVFFVAHAILPALAVIVTLLGSIFAFMVTTVRRDRPAFWAFVPYAAWVAYATLLNASIWWLN